MTMLTSIIVSTEAYLIKGIAYAFYPGHLQASILDINHQTSLFPFLGHPALPALNMTKQ